MKKKGLVIFTVCGLLGAASGCNKPVTAVVLVPDQTQYPGAPEAVYAEEGGTMEFRDETPNSPGFTVDMGVDDECTEGRTLTSRPVTIGKRQFQSATCHVTDKHPLGNYMYHLTPKGKTEPVGPPEGRHYYTRPCPPVCKPTQ